MTYRHVFKVFNGVFSVEIRNKKKCGTHANIGGLSRFDGPQVVNIEGPSPSDGPHVVNIGGLGP